MHNCFKTWAYWRPILILLWGVTGTIAFFVFASSALIQILTALALIAALIFLLHIFGYAFYESYMYKLKQNYKKITGKDWEDEN